MKLINDNFIESLMENVDMLLDTFPDQEYEVVSWPEIQEYMDYDDFNDNAALITPNYNMGIDYNTYLVNSKWKEKKDAEIR